VKQENIIKKITINIGGTEVEVTPKQAKNLHEALGELLGVNQITVKEYVPYRPYVYPYSPNITWCGGTNSTTTVSGVTAFNATSDTVGLVVQ